MEPGSYWKVPQPLGTLFLAITLGRPRVELIGLETPATEYRSPAGLTTMLLGEQIPEQATWWPLTERQGWISAMAPTIPFAAIQSSGTPRSASISRPTELRRTKPAMQ